eukprot:SRR837773.22184.p3 GENE.SRR837773.22184~~SRR837773.22184.p3  ORF type:complete len:103 (-),score=10.57 SRR837773.22184:196-504(-)
MTLTVPQPLPQLSSDPSRLTDKLKIGLDTERASSPAAPSPPLVSKSLASPFRLLAAGSNLPLSFVVSKDDLAAFSSISGVPVCFRKSQKHREPEGPPETIRR